MPHGAKVPRWFIVVRRDKPALYRDLRKSYEGDARVEVILDRRAAWPEMPAEAEVRRAERRMRERRRPQGDRRQAQRRQPLAPVQEEFWVTEGFFMVRRTTDSPRKKSSSS
jgi:hypothetical protein